MDQERPGFWILILLSVLGFAGFLFWAFPRYSVYQQRLEGQAILAHAQSSREVAVAEAKAKMESASLLAQADVERAKEEQEQKWIRPLFTYRPRRLTCRSSKPIGTKNSSEKAMTDAKERLRKKLIEKQAKIRDVQRDRIDQVHALCHEFMRDMDRAILIHEQLAELEGRDPSEVNSALWPVRTKP